MNVNVNLVVENVIGIKNGIMINVNVSLKKHNTCEKGYIWNHTTCSSKNGKYLANVMDDSVIKCGEVTEVVVSHTTKNKNYSNKF